jgi:uncharacterized protein YndB with AHSA1/START domain
MVVKTQDLVIERIFNAPVELVWKAWTDPEMLVRWWGPKDFTAPVYKLDFRVGGKFLYCMRSPDGKDYWGTGTFKEIVSLERIVQTDSFADEHGSVVSASHYGMNADFPLVLEVTLTFEDLGDRTKLTLRHLGMPAGEDAEGATAGWNESFDKLAALVER